nr:uncharacterized protein LOC117276856 [Nicotiana tomentosiformis]
MTLGGSSTISSINQMKILLWNCRGAANPAFIRNIKAIFSWNNPSILALTETKLYEDESFKEELGFSGILQARADGYSGGMVLLWKSEEVIVDPLVSTNQELHATVQVRARRSEHFGVDAGLEEMAYGRRFGVKAVEAESLLQKSDHRSGRVFGRHVRKSGIWQGS